MASRLRNRSRIVDMRNNAADAFLVLVECSLFELAITNVWWSVNGNISHFNDGMNPEPVIVDNLLEPSDHWFRAFARHIQRLLNRVHFTPELEVSHRTSYVPAGFGVWVLVIPINGEARCLTMSQFKLQSCHAWKCMGLKVRGYAEMVNRNSHIACDSTHLEWGGIVQSGLVYWLLATSVCRMSDIVLDYSQHMIKSYGSYTDTSHTRAILDICHTP